MHGQNANDFGRADMQSHMTQQNRTAPPSPVNPIPSALSQLGSAIYELGCLADSLVNRLGDVLSPEMKADSRSQTGTAPSVSQSPTCDEIHSLRRRVENICAQLQDALQRLEV